MKLKFAICDDDANQRHYISNIVSDWSKKNHHLIEIYEYPDAKSFLFTYETEKDFDILLLDVEMPEISGVQLAKDIRRENNTVQIVFITGFYEYFSDGFDVSALHYLIKPVNNQKLNPVLDKAVHNLAHRQRNLLLSTADGDFKVSLADIVYVESENVYVNVHTSTTVYRTRMSLGKFSEQLDETFFKIHRSYIVSLKYIKKITRTEVAMSNGNTLPISRGLYDSVHAALVKYL